VAAKLANVGVPLVMKASSTASIPSCDGRGAGGAARGLRLLRFSTTLFGELRDVVFVRVTQRAIRRVALGVFRHLHACRCASTWSARPAA
jgi:ATP-binding cassette subfamily B protein